MKNHWPFLIIPLIAAALLAGTPAMGQEAAENPAGAPEEPPAAPSELLAYDDAVASATFLSWQDNASNETTYIVERSVVGLDGPWDALATVPTTEVCRVPPTTCWYFDYDIEQEGDYWYRVAAVNESGQSPYSNFAQAGPQPRPGQVRGVVFHDRDEDGTLDPGEEGLPYRDVVLKQDGATRGSTGTGVDGTFTLEAEPATYDLEVDLDEGNAGCVDVFSFSFYPRDGSFCVGAPLPWTATMPSTVPVTVGDGQTVEVNFGARPTEAAVIVGRAVLEDRRAPPGTRIEALVNGRVCGTSTVGEDLELDFVINVLGQRERAGCARRGDVVSFRIGDVPAADTVSWVPFTEVQVFLQIQYQNLAGMEQHAWYWMEVPAAGLPGDGAPVRAMVGDTICGQTTIRTTQALRVFPPDQAGFSRLIVPSAEVQPGCGRAGATVTFTIDGRPAGSIPWQPGLQEIELGLRLPDTGSGGRSVRSSSGMGLVVLGVLGVLTLGAGGLLLRRR